MDKIVKGGEQAGPSKVAETPAILFPNSLHFYKSGKEMKITLEKLEDVAVARLYFFKCMHHVYASTGVKKYSAEWVDSIIKLATENEWALYTQLLDVKQAKTQDMLAEDYAAHIALQCYCIDMDPDREELISWIQNKEKELFVLRCLTSPVEDIKSLAARLDYEQMTVGEMQELEEPLRVGTALDTITRPYYRIWFAHASKLVATRSVYLRGGVAHVPANHLYACFGESFMGILLAEFAPRREHYSGSDKCINPRLKFIYRYLDEHWESGASARVSKKAGKQFVIAVEDVDEVAKKYFPLCMLHMHRSLRSEHSLKHQHRILYTPFLREIGLPVEGTLALYKDEWLKIGEEKRFRQYEYYVKHAYGLVGHKRELAASGCQRIGEAAVGCPFKHLSADQLGALLRAQDISPATAEEIVAASGSRTKESDCQAVTACRLYYKAKHSVESEHDTPTAYFENCYASHNEPEDLDW